MEFKGTKGKLEVRHNVDFATYDVINKSLGKKYHVAQCPYVPGVESDQAEAKANAQLISKAPEMLDFINRISGEMLRNDFVLDEKWYDQARGLIKEATEININHTFICTINIIYYLYTIGINL